MALYRTMVQKTIIPSSANKHLYRSIVRDSFAAFCFNCDSTPHVYTFHPISHAHVFEAFVQIGIQQVLASGTASVTCKPTPYITPTLSNLPPMGPHRHSSLSLLSVWIPTVPRLSSTEDVKDGGYSVIREGITMAAL